MPTNYIEPTDSQANTAVVRLWDEASFGDLDWFQVKRSLRTSEDARAPAIAFPFAVGEEVLAFPPRSYSNSVAECINGLLISPRYPSRQEFEAWNRAIAQTTWHLAQGANQWNPLASSLVEDILDPDNWWDAEDFDGFLLSLIHKAGTDAARRSGSRAMLVRNVVEVRSYQLSVSRKTRIDLWRFAVVDALSFWALRPSAASFEDILVENLLLRFARHKDTEDRTTLDQERQGVTSSARERIFAFELATGISPPALISPFDGMNGCKDQHARSGDNHVFEVCRSHYEGAIPSWQVEEDTG
jgi:hypothetical protein